MVMSQFNEQTWQQFLTRHKEVNFPGVPCTDNDYFVNSRELLHKDLEQMETEGPITFRFYPPQDKAALMTYNKHREIPEYYTMRFEAYAFYLRQQGKKLRKEAHWVGETYQVTCAVQ